MRKSLSGATPTECINNCIADLSDWRGKTLARLRKLIRDAAPNLAQQWKWNVNERALRQLVRAAVALDAG